MSFVSRFALLFFVLISVQSYASGDAYVCVPESINTKMKLKINIRANVAELFFGSEVAVAKLAHITLRSIYHFEGEYYRTQWYLMFAPGLGMQDTATLIYDGNSQKFICKEVR